MGSKALLVNNRRGFFYWLAIVSGKGESLRIVEI
jgi:hypothetical protein